MSADSYAGSPQDGDAHRDDAAIEQVSREDIESSVLDALRPLLGPKRKKASGADDATAPTNPLQASVTAPTEAKTIVGGAATALAQDNRAIEADKAIDDEDAIDATAAGAAGIAPAPSPEPDLPATTRATAPHSEQDRNPNMTYHATATAAAEDKALDTFVAGRDMDEFETFLEIGGDLERRSRRSATMARLLDQHHAQLQTAEKERDEAYEKLARVYPVVQETARALKEAMDSRKVDPDPARMARLFQLNGRALDELEKVAVTIFADFLWCKSAWELYAKTVGDARELRANADS